jgi:hypothetical protein
MSAYSLGWWRTTVGDETCEAHNESLAFLHFTVAILMLASPPFALVFWLSGSLMI